MRQSVILSVDAALNLTLGGLLVVFPRGVMQLLGVPIPDSPFYASILGAVLLGIGLALILEIRRSEATGVGLGAVGAIAINLCAASVLLLWLVFGKLRLPVRGSVLLWSIAVVVVVLSALELLALRRGVQRGG